jgi:hypothetical protein
VVPKLSERVQAAILIGVLVVAIGGLYGLTRVLQPAVVPSFVVHRVGLVVDGGAWSIEYTSLATTNNTAFSLLQEAGDRLGFGVGYQVYEIPEGVLVTSINGSLNGMGGRYWQYWVNDAYGRVAADRMPLADEDTVTWRFDRSYEGVSGA